MRRQPSGEAMSKRARSRSAGAKSVALALSLSLLGGCGARGLGSHDASATGGGAGPSGGSGAGGESGTGGGFVFHEPCTASEPTLVCTDGPPCTALCPPLRSGFRNCGCMDGQMTCGPCFYVRDPLVANYTCFHIPADLSACAPEPTRPDELPRAGGECTLAGCLVCGSATVPAYIDSSGTPKIGYCVCGRDGATEPGHYSCNTVADWPPQD